MYNTFYMYTYNVHCMRYTHCIGVLSSPLLFDVHVHVCVLFVQFHLDFIQTCMQRLQVAYDNLQQFNPGEIKNEPTDIQMGFNIEVLGTGYWVQTQVCNKV